MAKKVVTARRPHHRGNVSMASLLVSGRHTPFDIAGKALHNTLHLSHIGGHDVEHHVADAAIGIASDVVLDRRRAASQRLTRSPIVGREDDWSAEGNRNVLWVAPGLAGLVAQTYHSPAHLVGREAGW